MPQSPHHRDTEAQRRPLPEGLTRISGRVVDAAFRVHSALGPGLLERVYEVCLAHECAKRGLRVRTQVLLPVRYDTLVLEECLRLDMVVEDEVVVEVKAVETLLAVHSAQLITYLKLSGKRLGLLINFNTALIKNGIVRIAL
ncbi:MAG TPA: GxxExxY protein [Armatimonadota bacterium]|jgi:GxxExxY protein